MDKYTATERAYKNGYARGYEDGRRSSTVLFNSIVLDDKKMVAKLDFEFNGIKNIIFIPWDYGDCEQEGEIK